MFIRKSLLLLVAIGSICAIGSAHATLPAAQRVVYPAYDEVKGLKFYTTPAEYKRATTDKRFVMEKLAYTSDNLEVYAYIYRPKRVSGKLPAIIFNRGSFTWPTFAAELSTIANRLAQKGYVVIAPMYRGSGGAAGRDEMGGADLNDLFNLLPVLQQLGYVDSNRLYLYGESRGGMMVYQALRDGFPAKAAAVFGAFTDLEGMMQNPYWAEVGAKIWPELAQDRAAVITRRSAILWADKINIPILIMHGQKDEAVPVSQSLKMAGELDRLGKIYELDVMAGEGHQLAGRAVERDANTLNWFAKFTK